MSRPSYVSNYVRSSPSPLSRRSTVARDKQQAPIRAAPQHTPQQVTEWSIEHAIDQLAGYREQAAQVSALIDSLKAAQQAFKTIYNIKIYRAIGSADLRCSFVVRKMSADKEHQKDLLVIAHGNEDDFLNQQTNYNTVQNSGLGQLLQPQTWQMNGLKNVVICQRMIPLDVIGPYARELPQLAPAFSQWLKKAVALLHKSKSLYADFQPRHILYNIEDNQFYFKSAYQFKPVSDPLPINSNTMLIQRDILDSETNALIYAIGSLQYMHDLDIPAEQILRTRALQLRDMYQDDQRAALDADTLTTLLTALTTFPYQYNKMSQTKQHDFESAQTVADSVRSAYQKEDTQNTIALMVREILSAQSPIEDAETNLKEFMHSVRQHMTQRPALMTLQQSNGERYELIKTLVLFHSAVLQTPHDKLQGYELLAKYQQMVQVIKRDYQRQFDELPVTGFEKSSLKGIGRGERRLGDRWMGNLMIVCLIGCLMFIAYSIWFDYQMQQLDSEYDLIELQCAVKAVKRLDQV